jgi:hypothetical protein
MEIENLNSQKESRKFYKLVNNKRKDFKSRITACRKLNGKITNDKGKILERWKEYFKELLDGQEEEEQTQEETAGQNTPSVEHSENLENEVEEQRQPTMEEIIQAIKRINNNRALGPDNINGDIIKIYEPELMEKNA